MGLPPDIFMRTANEAIRRVALVALDRTVDAARALERGGSLLALRDALQRFDAQVSILGARFGMQGPTEAPRARALLERAAAPEALPGSAAALAEEVIAWSNRARPPLEVISMRLDAGDQTPPYGTVLAGYLRWVTSALVTSVEDRAPDDARELATVALALLFPVDECQERRALADFGDVRARLEALSVDGDAQEAEWEAFRFAIERLARSLEARTEREVEYKYLLRGFPPRAASARCKALAQGYVPGERLHERLRRIEAPGEVRYVRTVKLGSGLSRMEIEEETTERVFQTMWPLTEGSRIHKERYAVEDGALTWTIDRFIDRDLVLAEVEVPSADVAPSPPAWLAEYIVRDVTNDPRYVNLNLAR